MFWWRTVDLSRVYGNRAEFRVYFMALVKIFASLLDCVIWLSSSIQLRRPWSFLVVDCAESTQTQILRAQGLRIGRFSRVFITHMHCKSISHFFLLFLLSLLPFYPPAPNSFLTIFVYASSRPHYGCNPTHPKRDVQRRITLLSLPTPNATLRSTRPTLLCPVQSEHDTSRTRRTLCRARVTPTRRGSVCGVWAYLTTFERGARNGYCRGWGWLVERPRGTWTVECRCRSPYSSE